MPGNNTNSIKPIAGLVYFKQFEDFDAQLLRAFSFDKDFGPSFGLCLSTAMKISEGNFDSWYNEWKASGDKLFSAAETSELKNHNESAKSNYLESSVCYRTADFFIRQNLDDERLIPLADLQRESFRKGMKFFDFDCKVLNIPYENTTLDGYLFTADKSGKPKPTLIYITGYDSFVEESFYSGAYQALLRGYNVLTYDGPGQGQVLRRQKLFFRADWENVSKPVVDFAIQISEIDKSKIVLFGRSFAGYLAPRAACFDSRPAALVADAALYDLGEGLKKMLSPEMYQLFIDKKDDVIDNEFEKLFQTDKQKEFFFRSRMSTHGLTSVAQYLRTLQEFSLAGISKKIVMPSFICSGEFDVITSQQAAQLYENISSKDKTITIFKGIDGAGDHCEFANQDIFYTTVFDWLDERVK